MEVRIIYPYLDNPYYLFLNDTLSSEDIFGRVIRNNGNTIRFYRQYPYTGYLN